jgi:TonB family protein
MYNFLDHIQIPAKSIPFKTFMPVLRLISLLVPVFACGLSTFAQTRDTIYLNAFWRDTTADHATFYRFKVRQGAGWQVENHYMNGKVQMTGAYSDDSCNVRQGQFTWFDSTGVTTRQTMYRGGKEDGKETYTYPNKKIMITGSYRNGEKEGEWIGYYRSGQVAGNVVYENDKQVSGSFYNEDGSKNKKVKEFIRESEYPGGAAEWLRFLSKTLRYPDNAFKQKIEGTVLVQFIVNEEGNAVDIKVIKSVSPELDAEAVRVISASKDWVPAVYGGRFVKSYKKQPIVFKLTNS